MHSHADSASGVEVRATKTEGYFRSAMLAIRTIAEIDGGRARLEKLKFQ